MPVAAVGYDFLLTKELFAEVLHEQGPRSQASLLVLDLGRA